MSDGWDLDDEPELVGTPLLDALGAPSDEVIDGLVEGALPETGLFGSDEQFDKARQHWGGMPEFEMEELGPVATIVVKFASLDDRRKFGELIGVDIAGKALLNGIWYPKREVAHYWDKRYRDASVVADPAAPDVVEVIEEETEA